MPQAMDLAVCWLWLGLAANSDCGWSGMEHTAFWQDRGHFDNRELFYQDDFFLPGLVTDTPGVNKPKQLLS